MKNISAILDLATKITIFKEQTYQHTLWMRILTESDEMVKKFLRIQQKVLLLSFLQMLLKSIILVRCNNGFKKKQLKSNYYYSLFHIVSFIVAHITETDNLSKSKLIDAVDFGETTEGTTLILIQQFLISFVI